MKIKDYLNKIASKTIEHVKWNYVDFWSEHLLQKDDSFEVVDSIWMESSFHVTDNFMQNGDVPQLAFQNFDAVVDSLTKPVFVNCMSKGLKIAVPDPKLSSGLGFIALAIVFEKLKIRLRVERHLGQNRFSFDCFLLFVR